MNSEPGARPDRVALAALFLGCGWLLWSVFPPAFFTGMWVAPVVAGLSGARWSAWTIVVLPLVLLEPTYGGVGGEWELWMAGYPLFAVFGLLTEPAALLVAFGRSRFGRAPSVGRWSKRTRRSVIVAGIAAAASGLVLGPPTRLIALAS